MFSIHKRCSRFKLFADADINLHIRPVCMNNLYIRLKSLKVTQGQEKTTKGLHEI